jgi:hypothetical protein
MGKNYVDVFYATLNEIERLLDEKLRGEAPEDKKLVSAPRSNFFSGSMFPARAATEGMRPHLSSPVKGEIAGG